MFVAVLVITKAQLTNQLVNNLNSQGISLPSPLGEGQGVRPIVAGGEADCG